VILGDVNPGDITWTMTSANNNLLTGTMRSSLSIGTLYSLDNADSNIFSQVAASGPSFYVNGTITVANGSTTGGNGSVDLVVNANINDISSPVNSDFVFLHFNNADVKGAITGSGNTVLLEVVTSSFNGLITVGSYHTISESSIYGGMTVTSTFFAPFSIFADGTARGFLNSAFFGTFTEVAGPGSSLMRMDAYTNGFIKTISLAAVNPLSKQIVDDLVP